jgi:hypothetical protein
MENRNIGVVFIVSEQNSSQRYEKVGWDQNGIACGSVKPFGWQKGRCDSKGCGKAGWDQNGIAHGSVEPSPASKKRQNITVRGGAKISTELESFSLIQ